MAVGATVGVGTGYGAAGSAPEREKGEYLNTDEIPGILFQNGAADSADEEGTADSRKASPAVPRTSAATVGATEGVRFCLQRVRRSDPVSDASEGPADTTEALPDGALPDLEPEELEPDLVRFGDGWSVRSMT